MKKLKIFLSRYLDIKKNDSYVDMKKIKKILFYKTEWKIGEYITSSFVIREIKKNIQLFKSMYLLENQLE